MFNDIYFLDSKEALRVAAEKNRSSLQKLQVCYYAGEKIESDLVNLIHLPFENFVENLSQGRHRLPTKIDFTNLEISNAVKEEIENSFESSLLQVIGIRKAIKKEYINALKKRKLDFDQPWRFFLIAHSHSQVLQHVAKSIAETLKNMGYEVLFDLWHGTEDLDNAKNIFLFNPHVTINLNSMNAWLLSDDVFNFVWFQDPMPFLLDKTKVKIRKRDFVFSLLPLFDKMLQEKEIPFERQGFCVNKNVYKINPMIKREKKIVFIGSSYLKTIPNTQAVKEAFIELKEIFLSGKNFTDETVEHIALKFKLSVDFVRSRFIPYIVRDIGLLELCKLKSDYEIEIYGWGWEVYEELQPYYKGALQYGQEIADVYNSATFAFAPHQQYTLQQRTFEASACGAIPIVYDCRDNSGEESYEDALYYYKTSSDLEKILQADVETKNFTRLLNGHTYESFVEKILKTIEENR